VNLPDPRTPGDRRPQSALFTNSSQTFDIFRCGDLYIER
jgi:hypothetical protein